MNLKKSKISEVCFVLLLLLNIFNYSKYINIPSIAYIILQLGIYFVFLLFTLKTTYSKKSLFILLFIIIMCLLTTIITKNFVLILSFLLLYMSSEIDNKRIVELVFKCLFPCILIHFVIFCVLFSFGIETVPFDINNRVRLSLGFTTYNISGFLILWCYIAYIYLNDFDIKKSLLGIIIVYITYKFNDCRTALLCCIFGFVFSLIKNSSRLKKIVKFLCENIIIISVLLLFCSMWLYINDYSLGDQINNFTNERIRFASYLYNSYNVSIFGNFNDVVQNCDNTFAVFIYRFGIIYLFILNFLIRYIVKQNNFYDITVLLIWGIYASFENSCLTFIIAFPILFSSKIFINVKNRKDL